MNNMKIFFLLIFLSATSINAQEEDSIKFLTASKKSIEKEIRNLNDSLKEINYLLGRLKSDSLIKNLKGNPITVTTRMKAKLKEGPETYDSLIKEIDEGQEVFVVGLSKYPSVYKVCIDNICGFMNELFLKKNDQLVAYTNEQKQLRDEKNKFERERRIEKNVKAAIIRNKEKETAMLRKYGQTTYDKMKSGQIWIGMNKEQCEFSWGSPDDINKSVGSWGTHEQWVYDSGTYVYFENGKLTSWQD